MPAATRTAERAPRAQRGRRRRRAHPADALVIVAVVALAAGLLGARRWGLAPTVATPPTAAPATSIVAAPSTAPASTTTTTTIAPKPPLLRDAFRVDKDRPFAFGAALPPPVDEPPFAIRSPETARPVRVLVVGDALAAGLADGLARVGPPTGLSVRARTVAASGLSRPDLFDWPAQIASTVVPTDELVVVLVGLNDAQPLARWTTPVGAVGSQSWIEAYRARVARLVAGSGPRPVVLVGLPAVESSSRDRELEAVRAAVVAEAAAHANVRFLDLRSATSDDGKFARWLDQGDGQQVAARSNDGSRFTDAGNDLIAAALVAAVWPASPPA